MLHTLTPTQLQIITGGPPKVLPTIREPARAVQLYNFSYDVSTGMHSRSLIVLKHWNQSQSCQRDWRNAWALQGFSIHNADIIHGEEYGLTWLVAETLENTIIGNCGGLLWRMGIPFKENNSPIEPVFVSEEIRSSDWIENNTQNFLWERWKRTQERHKICLKDYNISPADSRVYRTVHWIRDYAQHRWCSGQVS